MQYLLLSWCHMIRSFLILVIIVIWKDFIFRVWISHLFHRSMVWEQIFLSNASLLRSLSAFCECAVAVDLFGSCLQRQNKEFIHQNFYSQDSENSTLRHCIFEKQATELNLFHGSQVLFQCNSETKWSYFRQKVACACYWVNFKSRL